MWGLMPAVHLPGGGTNSQHRVAGGVAEGSAVAEARRPQGAVAMESAVGEAPQPQRLVEDVAEDEALHAV